MRWVPPFLEVLRSYDLRIWTSCDQPGTNLDTLKNNDEKERIQGISTSCMLCMTEVIACLRSGVIADHLSVEKVGILENWDQPS